MIAKNFNLECSSELKIHFKTDSKSFPLGKKLLQVVACHETRVVACHETRVVACHETRVVACHENRI